MSSTILHTKWPGTRSRVVEGEVSLDSKQAYSWDKLLGILRCPACCRSLYFEPIDQSLPHAREYGVLHCCCARYPVVDGIPILTNSSVGAFEHTLGGAQYDGPHPEELIRLILAHRGLNALLRCIAFPLTFKSLSRTRRRRLWRSRPVQEILSGLRGLQLRRWCTASRNSLTAEDWFDIFFRRHSPIGGDLFSYFFYRFAQPRHLATLVLTPYLPVGQKPLLDLACGFGHLAHNLGESRAAHAVIGVDRNFFGLWTAQYWIAPRSRFVCANADKPLPFANGVFKGVLCSDAFHYFVNKDQVLSEIARCAPKQPVLLARVGNRLLEPNEGFELAPDQYMALAGDPAWQMFGENQLVNAYLRRDSVDIKAPQRTDQSNDEKWLYLVHPGVPTAASQEAKEWPHAVGRIGINPIFAVTKMGDGNWRLQFKFPSEHYASENLRMSSYLPQTVTVMDETLRQVKANVRSVDVDRLIEQLVVIGMPDQYVRAGNSSPFPS